ncbi:MAG TPA: FtsX-like permease family protein [Microthrixaceae bacterium]|nr:FtsX-like permease family protein [Microthrixaceae bacterium]
MRAVLMLSGVELRRRWWSVILVTVLVGAIGSVVLATAAGARRSASALERFNEYSRPATLQIEGEFTRDQVRDLRRVDGVLGVAVLDAAVVRIVGRNTVQVGVQTDDVFGTDVDRDRLVDGRRADPNAPHEVTISEGLSQAAGLGIGDRLPTASLTAEQVVLAASQFPGAPQGPAPELDIVGIVRRPLDLGDRAASGGIVILTPAFMEQYRGHIGVYSQVLRVRTTDASGEVERISAAARDILGDAPKFRLTDTAEETQGSGDAIGVITVALWVFCTVAALAGLVAIAIVLAREISLGRADQTVLRCLGLSRRQRIMTSAPTAFVVGAGGVAIAIVGAALASPLLPIGIARRADIDIGLHFDWTVMLLGGLAIAACVTLVATLAASRASHAMSPETASERARRSRSSLIARATRPLPPSLGFGTGLALERGRGARAVPVGSAVLGTAFGVLGITAVLVFALNLRQVSETPREYGWTWSIAAPDATFSDPCTTEDFGLTDVAGVSDVAGLCYQPVSVGGRAVTGWAFTNVRGEINPAVIEGRAAATASEVALGSDTLRELNRAIGDEVEIAAGDRRSTYRIVGRVIVPRVYSSEVQPLADGAVFTSAGFEPLKGLLGVEVVRYLTARVAPDADVAAVIARINENPAFNPPAELNFGNDAGAKRAVVPPEIERVRDADWITPALIALLAVLATIAVAHTIVTSVRRRRRELAVLKALGFGRRQLRLTVGWQATTLAVVGLVVGLPLGVLVGSLAWRLVAESLGVATDVSVPLPALAVVAVGALVIVNAAAFVPALSAARVRPAVLLRAE